MPVFRSLRRVVTAHGYPDGPPACQDVGLTLGVFLGVRSGIAAEIPPMALKELKARYATKRIKDYKLSDGEGLHLLVRPNGSKLWRLKYRFDGREKLLSLGHYPNVSLAQARLRRAEAEIALAEGRDPGAKLAVPAAMTFEAVARDCMPTSCRLLIRAMLRGFSPASSATHSGCSAQRISGPSPAAKCSRWSARSRRAVRSMLAAASSSTSARSIASPSRTVGPIKIRPHP